MEKTRVALANAIAERLARDRDALAQAWRSSGPVRHVWVDDLLDDDVARNIGAAFPDASQLMLKASMREHKRVGVAVDHYDALVREAIYAFQEQEVIDATRAITGHTDLVGDPSLYAGGISVMAKGDFLNPHIDNSHDGDIRLYRALNLLYYVSPGWKAEYGGSLELWDRRVREPNPIEARFNRLVIMETHDASWHSVSRITGPQPRCCVSNYFFSSASPTGRSYRNVTTFTGRPEEPLKRAALTVTDRLVLNAVGRWAPSLTKRTAHRRSTDTADPGSQ